MLSDIERHKNPQNTKLLHSEVLGHWEQIPLCGYIKWYFQLRQMFVDSCRGIWANKIESIYLGNHTLSISLIVLSVSKAYFNKSVLQNINNRMIITFWLAPSPEGVQAVQYRRRKVSWELWEFRVLLKDTSEDKCFNVDQFSTHIASRLRNVGEIVLYVLLSSSLNDSENESIGVSVIF